VPTLCDFARPRELAARDEASSRHRRPFVGTWRIQRTPNRRDFALPPFLQPPDRLRTRVLSRRNRENRGLRPPWHQPRRAHLDDDHGMDEVERALGDTPRGLIFPTSLISILYKAPQ
jgi:hypothetical protein